MPSEREPTTVNWSAELGTRLKQARLRAEQSQKTLADKLGVSQSTISNWERGYPGGPNDEELRTIEAFLGQTVADSPPPADAETTTDLGLWLRKELASKKEQGKTLSTVAAEAGVSVPTLYLSDPLV